MNPEEKLQYLYTTSLLLDLNPYYSSGIFSIIINKKTYMLITYKVDWEGSIWDSIENKYIYYSKLKTQLEKTSFLDKLENAIIRA